MVLSTTELLTERDGSAPQDALAELTGIRTGHTTAPRDLTLGRLLPDFHRPDQDELWAAGTVVAYLAVDPFFTLLTAADGLGWARVAAAALVWVIAPAALGAARLVRDDL